ncbi:MAG TPA: cation:proton antiporter [Chitinophagaceae bacterium]|nr:cation:proton antiporter [Chitinophagaceae bacterium]MCB9055779.1 cation:proton antiporter [Chitinophagales bacterium]HPG12136.1 cation:proton antiporter [Chitinophagaceae bacterium]
MNHLPHLITDLALILGVAAIVTLVFRKLKQPLVLGYIIAGILVSPETALLPSVYELKEVNVWGEIGVIFLLFSLGLEFSFKKLLSVGGSASVAASVDAVCMSALGFGVGQLLGWDVMDSVFLGVSLAISSTTIIIKAFDELQLKAKKFAQLVFGILIVQDLIAVVILALMSTFVVNRQVFSPETGLAVLKLLFFLVLWFITGIFFIPTLLARAKKLLSDELLLVISLAMCFGMVVLSSQAGFSPALGAFVMGSLLAETTKAEKIEHLVSPVKDLFGAIFFVSVGMLVKLDILAEYIGPILLISSTLIIGKIITIGIGTLISGNSLKVSLQSGMSLTQIGEFSFIIIALGETLNAVSPFLYPVIIAVSAITTFTTPYFIQLSVPFYKWIEKVLPKKILNSLNRFGSETRNLTSVNDWHQVLRSFLLNIIIFSVILVAIISASSLFLFPWIQKNTSLHFGSIPAVLITFILMAPFIWGLTVRNEQNEAFARIYAQLRYKGPIWVMRGVKIILSLLFIILLINTFFSISVALIGAVIMFTLFFIFRKKIQLLYDRLENRFIQNYNEREIAEKIKIEEKEKSRRNNSLAPWDAHMTTFEVAPELGNILGKTLEELRWRETIGINVAKIKRGERIILMPQKQEKIFPGDTLYIICTDMQEKKIHALLRADKKIKTETEDADVKLDSFTIGKSDSMIGKTIRESNIRTEKKMLVVGVERNGERILNPESNLVFHEGDLVWVVGETKLINQTHQH